MKEYDGKGEPNEHVQHVDDQLNYYHIDEASKENSSQRPPHQYLVEASYYKYSHIVAVSPYDIYWMRNHLNNWPHQREKLSECNMLNSTTPPQNPRRSGWQVKNNLLLK